MGGMLVIDNEYRIMSSSAYQHLLSLEPSSSTLSNSTTKTMRSPSRNPTTTSPPTNGSCSKSQASRPFSSLWQWIPSNLRQQDKVTISAELPGSSISTPRNSLSPSSATSPRSNARAKCSTLL